VKERPPAKYRLARQLGILTTIPLILAVAPMIGYFLGTWLDERLGTGPFLMVAFLLLGFGAGIRETVHLVRKAGKAAEEEDAG
jgi:F0F1-type ATP synthase assembly protein I